MEVILFVTRSCYHRSLIEAELKARHIDYEIRYVEDNPELVAQHGIKHSPNLIVDDELIYRGMPELPELKRFLDELRTRRQDRT